RRNGVVWSQVVIWTSVIGTFLAATGLYVGIARFRRNRQGRLASPFRGWWYWHHIGGLVFGVLVLTWVFSGLLTMNPWGWLEGSEDAARLRAKLVGQAPAASLAPLLEQAGAGLAGQDVRELRGVTFNGELRLLARHGDGTGVLLDARGAPATLDEAAVRAAFAATGERVDSLELLATEDAYYYGHKQSVQLPVW